MPPWEAFQPLAGLKSGPAVQSFGFAPPPGRRFECVQAFPVRKMWPVWPFSRTWATFFAQSLGEMEENPWVQKFRPVKSGDTLPCKRQNFMTARSHLSEKSVTLMNFHVSEQYFSCLSFVFIHTQTCNLFFPVVLCLIILQNSILFFQKIFKHSYK